MSNSQLAQSTQNEPCFESQQDARVCNGSAMCSKSVPCGLLDHRDYQRCMTAEIACSMDIKKIFYNGKDIGLYLSQDILRILHKTYPANQVMLYS